MWILDKCCECYVVKVNLLTSMNSLDLYVLVPRFLYLIYHNSDKLKGKFKDLIFHTIYYSV